MKKILAERNSLAKYLEKEVDLDNIEGKVISRCDLILEKNKELVLLESEIKRYKNKRNKHAAEISSLNKQIEEHLNSFFFFRLFSKQKYEDNKKKIRRLAKECKKENDDIQRLIKEYEKLLRSYHNIYEANFKDYTALEQEKKQFELNWNKKIDLLKELFYDKHLFLETIDISYSLRPSEIIDYLNLAEERVRQLDEILDEWCEYTLNTQNYVFGAMLLETVKLVGATCIGINSQRKFESLKFDVAIIDEAAQIQLQNALVPMSVATKTVMLGDYQQIPPIVEDEIELYCKEHGINTKFLKESLFEYLYKNMSNKNKVMLDTQYRLPEQIAEPLSEFFYSGNYKTCREKKSVAGKLPFWNTPFIIIDTSNVKMRHETKDSHYLNELEAKAIRYIISKIVEYELFDERRIHVIAPYNEQIEYLKQIFGEDECSCSSKFYNNISTLDSYQGQENDLIVYSFTRSSRINKDQKRIGFLREIRRLNVAMSRCKENLILVGDMNFLATCNYQDIDDNGNFVYEGSEKQFSDFINVLIQHVKERGTYVDCRDVIKELGAVE